MRLVDHTNTALARVGVRDGGIYLIRPDGYVAHRCAGSDLRGVEEYLDHWLRS